MTTDDIDRRSPIEIAKTGVILFLIFYGFFALTNPQMYPILKNTTNYGYLDPIIGIVMYISGIFLLLNNQENK